MSKPQPKCFRIANVPSSWSPENLLNSLQKIDPLLAQTNIREYQLSLYPACCGSTQTALLNFRTCTEYFHGLNQNVDHYVKVTNAIDGDHLVIDSHFNNLTPLNTPEEEVVADVVAVTGHAGHAFESWRSHETQLMWLKDFLPKDVKNIRIMTYGYDSNFGGYKNTGARLNDYRRNFIQQLQNSRSSESAMIFCISESAYHIPGA
ncbi:hypothetical protein BDD12DRAFT_137758 [Trichophaea hybrida]|nr:hypothetical protein BDD12DRAFT_137758 [Trichophaea hybrida]